ncbi:MAG TPA: CHAT domain-containing protein [Aquabacterium sp.]|nr:CHAT domain-containing protein [Aquabacterium sp.]
MLEAEVAWHPDHTPLDPSESLIALATGYNHLVLQAVSQIAGRYKWSPSEFLEAIADEQSELGFMARGSSLMLYASKLGSRAQVLNALTACAQEFVHFRGSDTYRTRTRILFAMLGLTVLRTEPQGSSNVDRAERANGLLLAAASFLDADLPEQAARCFDALDWKLAEPNPELDTFTVRLATVSSSLERRIGPRFCRRALHYWHQLLSRPKSSGCTLLAFEAAKGVLFASRYQNGASRIVPELHVWQETLAELEQLPAEAAAQFEAKYEAQESERLLFSSTGGSWGPSAGSLSQHGRLLELRMQLDQLVLGFDGFAEIPHLNFLGMRGIQELLQPKSVLVSLLDLPTESTTGNNTSYELKVLVVGKNSHRLMLIESGGVHFATGSNDESFDRFASLVAGWRQHILRELGVESDVLLSGAWPANVRDATSEEEAARFAGTQLFPPGLAEYLESLREQGADHLLINPHGSLHFCPFHLLADERGRVADRWTVTYLPVIGQLHRSPENADSPFFARSGAGVFGVSSGPNAPQDDHLPEAAVEVQTIAGVLGGTAFVDEQATRGAFLHALRTAKYVHVATHGEHCPYAPAFQRIFLSNDRGSDAVYAHEVLQVDLRGLKIISFSACETALGRYDEGDNLRGLAASCFLAGAQTVLGTMWSVADNVARVFFVAFYRELTAGRSKIDAFQNAQRRTRRIFPAAADWGSFVLIGNPY